MHLLLKSWCCTADLEIWLSVDTREVGHGTHATNQSKAIPRRFQGLQIVTALSQKAVTM